MTPPLQYDKIDKKNMAGTGVKETSPGIERIKCSRKSETKRGKKKIEKMAQMAQGSCEPNSEGSGLTLF